MKKWYIVHTFSGYESYVKVSLENEIKNRKMCSYFGDILIPTEDIIELRFGKKKKSKRKMFPGYVLVEMIMNDETWYLIRGVSQVLGFIGGSTGKPSPISDEEVNLILNRVNESSFKPKPKKLFKLGEMIRVVDGPFSDFNGTVEEVNYNKNRLCVGVLIFGRSTPIDLDFSQVEKI
ncbi:MAG TPA: transcription termination/antitermination protein NusG [Candidatus Azoamicus sp. MARI]